MKISILISKKENQVICKDDYKIGWLYQGDGQSYWSTWGSFKNLECALKGVKNVLEEKGEREVYLSDVRLNNGMLTLEQVLNLENITASFK